MSIAVCSQQDVCSALQGQYPRVASELIVTSLVLIRGARSNTACATSMHSLDRVQILLKLVLGSATNGT